VQLDTADVIFKTDPSDFGKSVRMTYATLFMRLALGFSFLSAVGDRFGMWGAYGEPHVGWGNFSRFTAYTGSLLWFLPHALYPLLAWAATAAETLLGLALILGLFTRAVAFLSAILLLMFALAMTFSLGIKAPLDYSVFSASAGGFLLAAFDQYPWSLDRVRHLRRKATRQ
jgi:uncharacterized membrane protein YphA (DoxX/SURF4 family)